MKKLAGDLIETLKTQPFALALVVVNIVFLIVFTLMLREVSQAIERRDTIIERCLNR